MHAVESKSAAPQARPVEPAAKPAYGPAEATRTPAWAAAWDDGPAPLLDLSPLVFQPKLAVGRADDPAEREADRIAERVLDGQDAGPVPGVIEKPEMRRACGTHVAPDDKGCDGCCASCRHAPQRPPAPGPAVAPAAVDDVLRSPGQPLDPAVRAFMEPRLGTDLGDVQVHTEAAAAHSAQAVGALAYTVGNQLVFADGQYQPDTTAGRRLLAHELAHTVQQEGRPLAVQREQATTGGAVSTCTGEPDFCTPYSSPTYARAIWGTMVSTVIPYVATAISADAAALWLLYLNRRPGASLTPLRFTPGSTVGQSFANSVTTAARQRELIAHIRLRLRRACLYVPTGGWGSFSVESLLPRTQVYYPINFDQPHETPGNIAGDVGSSDAGPDTRRVTGTVELTRTTNGAGDTTGGRLRSHFHFIVHDAVDLCPGGCGAWLEQFATVPLSRLEATGLAYDVPFVVEYDGPVVEETLLAREVEPCDVAETGQQVAYQEPETGREDVSQEPAAEGTPVAQAKLAVGQLGDPAEREADQIAEQVVRGRDSAPVPAAITEPQVRRACEETTCDGCCTSCGHAPREAAPAAVGDVLHSPGQPLDVAARAFLEPRFGTDLSEVRVHTDAQASDSAAELRARAYTVGNDIAFRSSEYAPSTEAGRRLLAHELTHVLQQSAGRPAIVQREGPDEPDEAEEPEDGGAQPLVIESTTFQDAAAQFAALLAAQGLSEPARLIVINGQTIRVFNERGEEVVDRSFRLTVPGQVPAGVFRMVVGGEGRFYAVVRTPDGGYDIGERATTGDVDINITRDVADLPAYTEAISGGRIYVIVPTLPANVQTPEPAEPEEDLPEYMRLEHAQDADLRAWPAAVTPLPPILPVLATVNSMTPFQMHVEKNFGVNTLDRVTNLMEPTRFVWQVMRLGDDEHIISSEQATPLGAVAAEYRRRLRDVEADRRTLLGRHPEQQSVPRRLLQEMMADQVSQARETLALAGQTAITVINAVIPNPGRPNLDDYIDVPWSEPGEYFVRCVATPVAGESAQHRRASSVGGVRVSVYNIEEVATEGLPTLAREQEVWATNEAQAQSDLAEIRSMLEAHEGNEAWLRLQLGMTELLIEHLHTVRDIRTDDIHAVKTAELAFIRAQIAYLTGPRAPGGEHAGEVQRMIAGLRAQETAKSAELGRADARLYNATRTAMMRALLVDEATASRTELLFTIGEEQYVSRDLLEVVIADITMPEGGRRFTGMGDGFMGAGRTEAWQNAMWDLRQNLNRGRGTLSYRVPPPYDTLELDLPNPMQLQMSMGDQLREMVDDTAHAMTLAALLAAPFTGGASLEVLAVLVPVQAATGLYNLLNRALYDDLRLDVDSVMSFINVATFGVGRLAGLARTGEFATRGMRIYSTSTRVAVRLLDGGGYVVLAYQTYEQLTAPAPEGEDPRQARRRRLIALLNVLEAASIPVAAHLWPPGVVPGVEGRGRPRVPGVPPEVTPGEPHGGESPSVRPRETEPAEPTTPAGPHPVPTTEPAHADLVRALPENLRHIPILRDTGIPPTLPPRSVRVHYELDSSGLVTDIRIVLGADVGALQIREHVPTVRLVNGYTGFVGRLRLLFEQLGRLTGLYGAPQVGSLAWEADLELRKLPEIIRNRLDRLNDPSLDAATRRELETELTELQSQLAEHAANLDAFEQSGRGFIAAEGVSEGTREALRLGYPVPPLHGYMWRVQNGELQLVANPNVRTGQPRPRLRWDPAIADYVAVVGGRRQEARFDPGTTPERAFDLLGGSTTGSDLNQFVSMLQRLGLITAPADFVETLGEPRGRTYRTVRDNAKQVYFERLLGTITNPATALEGSPARQAYDVALEETGSAAAARRRASYRLMIEATEHLGSQDAGTIGDQWYQRMYGTRGTVTQVEVPFTRPAGSTLPPTRVLDNVEVRGTGDARTARIREQKNIVGGLGLRDRQALEDQAGLVGTSIGVRGHQGQILVERLTVVFQDARGVRANAEWMRDFLARHPNTDIQFEIFNVNGERLIIDQNNLNRLDEPGLSRFLRLP